MRNKIYKYTIRTVFFIFISGLTISYAQQRATFKWKMHNAGQVFMVMNNIGSLNTAGIGYFDYRGLINCEYPAGSGEEHISNGGLHVIGFRDSAGVIDTLSSLGFSETSPDFCFFPSAAPWDTIYEVHRGDTVDIGEPGNPYWKKYIGISDQDFVSKYTDYGPLSMPKVRSKPLFLDIIQTSYAWSNPPLDEVIVIRYYVVAKKFRLRNIYFSSWQNNSVGLMGTDFGMDDFSYFMKDKMICVCEDIIGGSDGTAISAIARRIYPPPPTKAQSPNRPLILTYRWYDIQDGGGNNIQPSTPVERYLEVTDGFLKDRQPEIRQGTKDFLAFGPYELRPDLDTVIITVAQVFGKTFDLLLENVATLDELIKKDFRTPAPPPPPPLRITADDKKVTLNWRSQSGEVNPELYQDPNRTDTVKYPFEGYRVYKSTKGPTGPWTLLAEYDKVDGIGTDWGIDTTYTDTGLLNNIEYYYAVTSFSMPDRNFPPQESSINANAKVITPGPKPPKTIGEVAVVPNPYRGDIAYQTYDPPWEKPQGQRKNWMEQDRRIQFINLPARCEIKVYSLSGDLVTTIQHDNPLKGYEDWNLTSNVGQAISSGIYLFTVQDLTTGKAQIGKFVIIK